MLTTLTTSTRNARSACAAALGFGLVVMTGCEPTSPSSEPGAKTGPEAEAGAGTVSDGDEEITVSTPGTEPPFGNEADVAHAEELWRTGLADYTSWSAFGGLDGWQPGQSPHGTHLKYFINAVAAGRVSDLPPGSLIVKENYSAREDDALVAVTVMQRIDGYDPDHGDWFWVKYGPDGEIETNPKGVELAGRVASGTGQGCLACHATAGGDDFVFAND